MKHKKLIALGVFILFAIGVMLFLRYKSTHISTDDAYITNNIYWVNPKVSGSITKVLITNNMYVKKGRLLAVIDQKPYKIALQAAEAEVSLYKAKLKEAEALLKQTEAEALLTNTRIKKAQWDFTRAKRLFSKKVISKDTYEKYLTALNVLKAQLKANNAAIARVKASIGSLKKAVDAAKAKLNSAKLNLSYTLIKAPHDGYITKKSIEVGKFVSPALPICAIVPKNGAWIVANYKETQLHKIKIGDRVKISIDAYPSKTFYGYVQSIQYGTGEVFSLFPPQNASGNWIKVVQRVPVKIVFDRAPEVPLRVGMSATTVVLVGEHGKQSTNK